MNFTQDELEELLRSLMGEELETTRTSLEALDVLSRAQQAIDKLMGIYARGARDYGETWEAIGSALGTSRQAAQQRYGTPRD